jgi:hypothetical protein
VTDQLTPRASHRDKPTPKLTTKAVILPAPEPVDDVTSAETETEPVAPEPSKKKPSGPPGGTRRMITAFLIVGLILAAVVALSVLGVSHHRGSHPVRVPAHSGSGMPARSGPVGLG